MGTYLRSPFGSAARVALAVGALEVGGIGVGAKGPAKKHVSAPVASVAVSIRAEELVEVAQKLGSAELGVRTPGSPADAKVRAYLSQKMSELKLQPGGKAPARRESAPAPAAAKEQEPPQPQAQTQPQADAKDEAGFLQPVSLLTMKTRLLPEGVPRWKSMEATVPVQLRASLQDVVLFAGEPQPVSALSDAEVVFVGYGLIAPEYHWDDYKDADVQGKVVLILDGEPQEDAKVFAGKSRLYYGRYTHKFAQAAQKGAAAALVIVDNKDSAAAGVDISTLRNLYGSNAEYVLDRDPAMPETGLKVRGFMTEELARRVLQAARTEFDEQRRLAEQRDFRPLRPKLRMSTSFKNELRPVESANIVGVLPGTEPVLNKEAVIYTAHVDGRGALNSTPGIAALLAIARAAVSQGPAARTLVFAALTGKTDYLQGAYHLLAHLPEPVEKVIAHINLDGISPFASSLTVMQIGRGKSTLDAVLDAAVKAQGRRVIADVAPELGLYYRSDSLAFSRSGIPSLFLGWPELGRSLREDNPMPQAKEGVNVAWTFAGGAQDAELLLAIGRRLADGKTTPAFQNTDEFSTANANPIP